MPREDNWVAVAPDASSAAGGGGDNKIKPATSAFQYFQRDFSGQVKEEITASNDGKFEVGKFSKRLRELWSEADEETRAKYEKLATEDMFRFRSESHKADVEAMERRERLQRERETILLDDEGGFQRGTRGQRAKKERGDDSSDDDEPEKVRAPRQLSAKQIERKQKLQAEREEKEAIIAEQQEDIRKGKAAQAKKRLDFLLKQSNIFSHFGKVTEDSTKFGTKASSSKKATTTEDDDDNEGDETSNKRRAADIDVDADEELEEADEHETTYLTAQPTTLAFGKMREYQLEGLNWMIRLQENGVNGILADEMGLGKTLQSISILVYMLEYRNVTGPHLIIVPKSTLSNWMNELARWAPTLTAVRFHGNKESREEIVNNVLRPGQRDSERTWNVVVTTYEICNIEKNALMKFAWTYLIIDEAHRLKNEASTFSQTVRAFETRYRILITGTPLQNSLHELWALLNFLVPDVFADSEQFDEWFNLDIDDDDEKNRLISQLHKILRPFMLRRLKKEVEKNLPPKHEMILFTGMSAMQKKLYRDILIRDIDAIQGTSGSRTAILNIVMQLRKCAGHPYLFPGVEDRSLPPLGEHLVENCGKMVLLDKLLKRLKERGHRVLLFTQMTRILDIMEDYLRLRRYNYCRIDGNTSYELREDYIDAYNAPNSEIFIFLLSTRAGGLGINLQTADIVILYDSDWNPQADLQAQDRAHRIGQKREVQVFRLVTEHTIEEKVVERAQQKLKLDAMVVQQGRLKEKDKLSRDELLQAVRFGADKIFKSNDSSITDEDIDMIIDAGRKKTMELNDKLKTADKGDLLDFAMDGGSNMQTFEGVDYSKNALAAMKAESELLGIFDIGKRERKTVANYNESKLYEEQVAAMRGIQVKERKKKTVRLPKGMRLPRMGEWQMYNQQRLHAIEEAEENSFKALPEDVQKQFTQKYGGSTKIAENTEEGAAPTEGQNAEINTPEAEKSVAELPPLLSEEMQQEKEQLLQEGFSSWSRNNYSDFVKACGKYGRGNFSKIAENIKRSEDDVKMYASAFWGDQGKQRISEHEYERVINEIEKGERKIAEAKQLARAVRVLISIFDNPWEELEFSHVNAKDKNFSLDNDRYLLCWTHKFGVGQWQAIKMAIRRSPKFRFDYYLRSLPIEAIGRRCNTLMKCALKEVDHLEKQIREADGVVLDESTDNSSLPPIPLPRFKEMKKLMIQQVMEEKESKQRVLTEKVASLEKEIQDVQDCLKMLSKEPSNNIAAVSPQTTPVAPRSVSEDVKQKETPKKQKETRKESPKKSRKESPPSIDYDETKGAFCPTGEFVEFPEYDGSYPPKEAKKSFAVFCNQNRKEVKSTLDENQRKNKEVVNELLKKRFMALSEEDKQFWRDWAAWEKKRYKRDHAIFERVSGDQAQNNPEDRKRRKRRASDTAQSGHIPKKKKKL